MTHLERAIRSQPAELERLSGQDLAPLAARLENRRRVWLVGTGSSQHVDELRAILFAHAALCAPWSASSHSAALAPQPDADDAVIVISHTGRTSYAVAAR